MKVDIVNINRIITGERYRTDYGNLDDLVNSVKIHGLIQPLAVREANGDFILLAGGRRLQACSLANIENIPVRIYPENLSEFQLRSIELEENIQRKDLTYKEDCYLKREIHRLQISIKGEKVSTSKNAPGHSMNDTAIMLGVSKATVSQDIKLANTMDNFPDLEWSKCKNKKDAVRMMDKFEDKIIRAELSDRASKIINGSKKQLMDSYIVGDFFDKSESIPNKSINFVEIDPPYGIELKHQKMNNTINYGQTYNEIEMEDYIEFLKKTLKISYRILTDDSWLVLWFAPDPWFDIIQHLVTGEGFNIQKKPCIWTKPNGQCNHPDIQLATCYEMFYVVRKGNPIINIDKRGRCNIFNYSPVLPSKKTHPTERPIELMKEILSLFTHENDRVIVPFAGSGVTLRAAYDMKIHALGYDLAKEYKDGFVANILDTLPPSGSENEK